MESIAGAIALLQVSLGADQIGRQATELFKYLGVGDGLVDPVGLQQSVLDLRAILESDFDNGTTANDGFVEGRHVGTICLVYQIPDLVSVQLARCKLLQQHFLIDQQLGGGHKRRVQLP